jgi:hypothetical protein
MGGKTCQCSLQDRRGCLEERPGPGAGRPLHLRQEAYPKRQGVQLETGTTLYIAWEEGPVYVPSVQYVCFPILDQREERF